MNARAKNLALAAGAVTVVGFVGVNTLMTPPAAPPYGDGIPVTSESHSPAPDPAPAGAASAHPSPPEGAERRSYAIGLQDLSGLPPDAAPGSRIELWVTWEPPLTRRPRLQKLIGDVVLERTIPGTVPEAPVSVLLSVPVDRVGDLIYADGFGRLSAALPE